MALEGHVPPDLYLRAESFSFQLQDNPFESNFKSNHMVWSGWCSGWCRVCGVGGAGCVEWVGQWVVQEVLWIVIVSLLVAAAG